MFSGKVTDLKESLGRHGVGLERLNGHVEPALPLALPHLAEVARAQLAHQCDLRLRNLVLVPALQLINRNLSYAWTKTIFTIHSIRKKKKKREKTILNNNMCFQEAVE